jgi:4-diphosphocytidyl-2-C-methyl-D-erythritol kinase
MLTVQAPAKINWFLHILGKRGDGYHEIQSLIQKVTLYDRLTFTPSETLQVQCSSPIPLDENIVYKAASALRIRCGVDNGMMITLEKGIPMGAGLGGGSSDAAAALMGLNELWSLKLSQRELALAAEELGSDVPFFLKGALSRVSGRGEQLTPCRAVRPLTLLLVKPSFDVSTAWVYNNFSLLTKKDRNVNNIKHFIRIIESADIDRLSDELSNDLESVTLSSFPVIAGIKMKLRDRGAVFSLMSGSGSTVFGVFRSRARAEEAAEAFREHWTAVVETIVD